MSGLGGQGIAGLRLARTAVIGIVNVTPDSFSDGGRLPDTDAAVRYGVELMAAGADIVDVGGESTRPGARRVPPAQEQGRVLPVVAGLAAAGCRVSIDTMRADTARAAVRAGAVLVNDVSGGLADPAMLETVAELGVAVVLMHWRAHSDRMDQLAVYRDVVAQVRDELALRRDAAVAAGVHRDHIVLDPGLGFAKRADHNWAVLANLHELFADIGQPVMLGASRKRFLGQLLGEQDGLRPVDERDCAAAAVSSLAAAAGVWGVRVHDVQASADAVRVEAAWRAAAQARRGSLGRPQPQAAAVGRIVISGIRAQGFHGVLASERAEGQEFIVDVTVHCDTRSAAQADDLAATVDYAAVAATVERRISGQPFQLIESLAEAIAADLLDLARVLAVDVRVHKPSAPIPVEVGDVEVRISRQR